MASVAATAAAEAAAADARRRPRVRATPRLGGGGVIWIAAAAVMLAGVVFLNVAVLRLNLSMDELARQKTQLRAENAALASQVSSAADSLRIEAQARRQLGLEPAAPEQITYLDLTRR